MNNREIAKAKQLLADRTQLTEISGDGSGGLVLSVSWNDGGQHIFWTFEEVVNWLAEKTQGGAA